MSSAEEATTKALVASSTVLRPKRRETCATTHEPMSPPRPKPLTISDHCHRCSGVPAAAREAGAMCSRLLSTPVPKPNWNDVPIDTALTTTTSFAIRSHSGTRGASPRSG